MLSKFHGNQPNFEIHRLANIHIVSPPTWVQHSTATVSHTCGPAAPREEQGILIQKQWVEKPKGKLEYMAFYVFVYFVYLVQRLTFQCKWHLQHSQNKLILTDEDVICVKTISLAPNK